MINPLECVSQITINDPQLAVPLFDLLVFAASPGFADSAEYDQMLDMLYAHTPDCRSHRERYQKTRAA